MFTETNVYYYKLLLLTSKKNSKHNLDSETVQLILRKIEIVKQCFISQLLLTENNKHKSFRPEIIHLKREGPQYTL